MSPFFVAKTCFFLQKHEDYVDNECLYEKKNALHKKKFDGEEMPKKSCSALVME